MAVSAIAERCPSGRAAGRELEYLLVLQLQAVRLAELSRSRVYCQLEALRGHFEGALERPEIGVDAMKKPVVDQEAYDALSCNRCGDCCELFYPHLSGEPLDLLIDWGRAERFDWPHMPGHPEWDRFRTMMWYGEHQPIRKDFGWAYQCGKFQRDEEGQGVCLIQDDKPGMCSRFPYGRPVLGEQYSRCTWARVQLLDFQPFGIPEEEKP